jgi:hypothetical protein
VTWFVPKPDLDYVWRCLSTKFECWSYEREWRVFTTLKDRVWSDCAGRELFFADFGKELALKEVILGAECDTAAKEIFEFVASDVRVARVHLVEPTDHSDSFKSHEGISLPEHLSSYDITVDLEKISQGPKTEDVEIILSTMPKERAKTLNVVKTVSLP